MKPYMDAKELAEEFNLSTRTIYTRLKGLEEEISSGRYPRNAVIRDEKIIRISSAAILDYMTYRSRLSDRNTRKRVPPYNPRAFLMTREPTELDDDKIRRIVAETIKNMVMKGVSE